jgi:hypothetical protein
LIIDHFFHGKLIYITSFGGFDNKLIMGACSTLRISIIYGKILEHKNVVDYITLVYRNVLGIIWCTCAPQVSWIKDCANKNHAHNKT